MVFLNNNNQYPMFMYYIIILYYVNIVNDKMYVLTYLFYTYNLLIKIHL